MTALLHKLWVDDEGQGMVEYGLIIALVAIGVIVALRSMGTGLSDIFDKIQGDLAGATSGTTAP